MKFLSWCFLVVVAQCVLADTARSQDQAAQNEVAFLEEVPPSTRCASLYAYVWRYEINPVIFNNTGRRLRADVAAALCEEHDYARGISILESEVRGSLLPPATPKL